MGAKSYYDLDHIIELSEKRVEQYQSAYLKQLERFTHLILIYSAITIFLARLIKDAIKPGSAWWLTICFLLFAILFLISIYYAIRLILPADVSNFGVPRKYYTHFKQFYEVGVRAKQFENELPVLCDQELQYRVDQLLKGSYINELERIIENIERLHVRKCVFYFNALRYVLFAAVPYLFCLISYLIREPI